MNKRIYYPCQEEAQKLNFKKREKFRDWKQTQWTLLPCKTTKPNPNALGKICETKDFIKPIKSRKLTFSMM